MFSDDDDKLNIHQELLSKPEREQITWDTHYLQPEREDEKTLVKKANDLTDRVLSIYFLKPISKVMEVWVTVA